MIRTSVFFGAFLVVGIVLLAGTSGTMAQDKGPHTIDPTADVHPSVILEGKVTIGAYTKIDAGNVRHGGDCGSLR